MRKLSAIDTELEAGAANTSSERSFGLVFAGVFAIIGAWPLLRGHEPRLWAFPLAAVFLLAGLFAPKLLRPLNVLWTRLGSILHRHSRAGGNGGGVLLGGRARGYDH